MRILSVEETFKVGLRRMPRGLAQLVLSVWAIVSWLAAPVNFLSQIADLRLVLNFWSGLLARVGDLRPVLTELAKWFGPVVGLWRQITAPLRDWASSLLSVDVPAFWIHLLLMLALSVPALLRLLFAHSDIVAKAGVLRSALLDKLNSYSLDESKHTHGQAIINGLLANPSLADLDDLEKELKWGNLRRLGVRYDSSVVGAEDQTVRDKFLDVRGALAKRASAVRFLGFAATFTVIGGLLVIADMLMA
jgi:hypothetical protein